MSKYLIKKILVLFVLTSCEVIKPDTFKKSGDNQQKPNITQPTETLRPLSPEEQEKQEAQQKTNQLWIKNLGSQENYTIKYSDRSHRWETTKIDITEKGDFAISNSEFKFINAQNDSEANYQRSTMDGTDHIILKIKGIEPSFYADAKAKGFDDIDKYKDIVEGTFSFGFTDAVLYRPVPNANNI